MTEEMKTDDVINKETAQTHDLKSSSSLYEEQQEKTIGEILINGLEKNIDKKERENVDDDKELSTKHNEHDRYAHGKESGEAGKEGDKSTGESRDSSPSSSNQDDPKGSGSGTLEETQDNPSDNQAITLNKLQEELTRNKKWGHDLARKLKSYQGKLESYIRRSANPIKISSD